MGVISAGNVKTFGFGGAADECEEAVGAGDDEKLVADRKFESVYKGEVVILFLDAVFSAGEERILHVLLIHIIHVRDGDDFCLNLLGHYACERDAEVIAVLAFPSSVFKNNKHHRHRYYRQQHADCKHCVRQRLMRGEEVPVGEDEYR